MRRAAFAAALAILALATLAAGYAPGVCQAQCGSKREFADPNNLPGEVCSDSGPCGALIFPGSDPKLNTTRCLEDFEQTCDQQRGCSGCALWAVVERCGTAQQREECLARDTYVLLRAVESDAATGLPCQTLNHWMVLPRTPCTGVESPDQQCTGPQGEQWWSLAFAEATQNLGFSLAANATPWAVMVGNAIRRSQHQMHLRIDDLATSLDTVQELEHLAAAGLLSTNASDPTLIDSSETTVQPWATAAALAQADPDNPHGVLLAPYLVPAVDGSGEEEGFIVAAVFDTNSSEMQAEGDSCKDGGTPVLGAQPETAGNTTSAPASGGERSVPAGVVTGLLFVVAAALIPAWG